MLLNVKLYEVMHYNCKDLARIKKSKYFMQKNWVVPSKIVTKFFVQ